MQFLFLKLSTINIFLCIANQTKECYPWWCLSPNILPKENTWHKDFNSKIRLWKNLAYLVSSTSSQLALIKVPLHERPFSICISSTTDGSLQREILKRLGPTPCIMSKYDIRPIPISNQRQWEIPQPHYDVFHTPTSKDPLTSYEYPHTATFYFITAPHNSSHSWHKTITTYP